MSKNVVTEIVEFNVVPGIPDKDFVRIVGDLEVNFHSKQNGFMDTELVKGKEEGQWLMIQHWETMDEVKEAARMMFKTQITEEFRQSIDPKSVKMSLLEQAGRWEK